MPSAKARCCRAGAPATAGLFAPEQITLRMAGADELRPADRLLAALPFGRLLYARIDLMRDGAGAPRLLELEITEPSLFLAHAEVRPRSLRRCSAASASPPYCAPAVEPQAAVRTYVTRQRAQKLLRSALQAKASYFLITPPSGRRRL